jgi:pyruvate/2-oxoglutarate dehydrogenase complex dihydrolipoamide dehydrogenase (E3) component
MTRYDAIVMGAGQAGPGVAAAIAADGGRVALTEIDRVGGTCLNHGCRPTKALRASARIAHLARRAGEYGVRTGEVTVDFGAVMRRMRDMIDGMRSSLVEWLDDEDHIDVFGGPSVFDGSAGGVHRVRADGQVLESDRVYVDVGARAGVPPIDGLDRVSFLTEVELLGLDELPGHLIVVGAGYIGLEFGQMFRRFGSQVTMIAGSRVAVREDEDVSAALADILTGEGVRIVHGRASRVWADDGGDGERQRAGGRGSGGVVVEVDGQALSGSHLLVATGRVPNSDRIGAETVGLELDERGYIKVDGRFETSVPGIRALGDVNGRGAFTHTAYHDAGILLDGTRSVDGRITTYAMFTDPPLGRVGMTLAQARQSGRNVLSAELPMSSVSRAILDSETEGLMRILVDADTEEFLGATFLGMHGDDLAQLIGFAMQTGARYPAVRDALPIHPTVAEFIPTLLGSLSPLDEGADGGDDEGAGERSEPQGGDH